MARFARDYIDHLEFAVSPAVILLFLTSYQRYINPIFPKHSWVLEKDFENNFKNEIKRAYEYHRSPWYFLYLAGLSDLSSKTTKDILVLFALLKFFHDPILNDKKKFLKIFLKIKSGELRNFRLYYIFTFPFVVILLLKIFILYFD